MAMMVGKAPWSAQIIETAQGARETCRRTTEAVRRTRHDKLNHGRGRKQVAVTIALGERGGIRESCSAKGETHGEFVVPIGRR